MIRSNIKDWLETAFEELDKLGQAQGIHADNFRELNKTSLDKNNLLYKSIFIFNEGCEKILSQDRLGIQLDLRIELKECSNQIIGVPKTIEQLIEALEGIHSPEIVLFKPVIRPFFPVIEYYASPLPFELSGVFNGTKIIYEEYRTVEELLNKEEYQRWLTFSYFHTATLLL